MKLNEGVESSLSAVEAFFYLLLPSEVGLGEGRKCQEFLSSRGWIELRGSRPGSGITCYSGLGRVAAAASSWCHRMKLR